MRNVLTLELNEKGYLKNRETHSLEFKESFHYGDNLAEYSRSMVGLANHAGGEIIFGVKDSPRIPIGLLTDKFENCDNRIISQFLLENFSHDFEWGLETFIFAEKKFGRIWVSSASKKPIICKKNYKNTLREAAVYYRYRGQTSEIKFSELMQILDNEREKERKMWISHIEKVNRIGLDHIHILDSYKGELHYGTGKILLDKDVLGKLKFIKEGEFVEKDGAPTLMLVGKVENFVDGALAVPTDMVYPHLTGDVANKFSLDGFQIQAILWKLKIKGDLLYHSLTKTSKNSKVNKYSDKLIDLIELEITKNSSFPQSCAEEYKKFKKNNTSNHAPPQT